MTPYLILHKVRGAPAYDVAHRMDCPSCAGIACDSCDGLGYWWIVSTSGHRAYPLTWQELIPPEASEEDLASIEDHYFQGNLPDQPKHPPANLLGILGLGAKEVVIKRRL